MLQFRKNIHGVTEIKFTDTKQQRGFLYPRQSRKNTWMKDAKSRHPYIRRLISRHKQITTEVLDLGDIGALRTAYVGQQPCLVNFTSKRNYNSITTKMTDTECITTIRMLCQEDMVITYPNTMDIFESFAEGMELDGFAEVIC